MNNSREKSLSLMQEWITNESLRNHCIMVSVAMEGYAKALGKDQDEIDRWWTAGLLHDLDWEKYPDEHPNKAVNEILPQLNYEDDIIQAIKAHGPERTGKEPETEIERYLFACDELSGFLNACSLVRPTKFEGMEVKSVKKRLKSLAFAANVSREDIMKGSELINKPLDEHIAFLISVFQ